MSKIKEISTLDELFEILFNTRIHEEYKDFSARFSFPSKHNGELRIEAFRGKFVLKIRPILQPTRKLLKEDRGSHDEILLCPHIPEPLAADLRKEGIAHADLNGRLFVNRPELLVYIQPTKVRYRNSRSEPDPFSPKASRLIRTLLSLREVPLTQEELELRTGVSRAVISQVLARLVSDDLVNQLTPASRRTPAIYQLADFDRLLDSWCKSDNWSKRTTIHQFSVLSDNAEEIAQKLVDSLEPQNIAFTQWFAAWLRKPHTTPPIVSAYLKQRRLLEIIPGRRVTSGGNLWLIIPDDEGVFLNEQESQGFPLVSDVQIYLDLLQVGQRGPEAAAELRAWEGFAR